jgi:hypothetical protein
MVKKKIKSSGKKGKGKKDNSLLYFIIIIVVVIIGAILLENIINNSEDDSRDKRRLAANERLIATEGITGEVITGLAINVGDCCTIDYETEGCTNSNIETFVCSQDPFCCEFYWDEWCVDSAKGYPRYVDDSRGRKTVSACTGGEFKYERDQCVTVSGKKVLRHLNWASEEVYLPTHVDEICPEDCRNDYSTGNKASCYRCNNLGTEYVWDSKNLKCVKGTVKQNENGCCSAYGISNVGACSGLDKETCTWIEDGDGYCYWDSQC